jgi:hypothetical protein
MRFLCIAIIIRSLERIIKFKHDDSEVFDIIEKGLENLENQSNGFLMV